MLSASSYAQPDTVIFKPGPQEGFDALISKSYGCKFYGESVSKESQNNGAEPQFNMIDWTYNAQGCNRATTRSLIRFNALNSFSAGTTIVKATLKLYGLPDTTTNNYGNSSFPGSPHGTSNEGWISRITADWEEFSVTWNNQPPTTTTNRATVPVSTSHWNWNTSIDVTEMVKDILTSGQNYGFMMQLKTEESRRQTDFGSSDHLNPALWPELVIIYNNPVSVAQVNAGAHLSIAPNPATNAVQVALPENHNGSVALQVTDITGKVIYRQQTTGQQQLTFSVAGWAKGLYLLQVTGSNWRAVEKLNVQ